MEKTQAILIRDAAYDLILGLGLLKTMRVVPTFQWQPEDQDACGVYLLREGADADGDASAGEPHFENTLTIGISILARANDSEGLIDASDGYVEPILSALLRTPDFLAMFRGITGYTRQPTFPPNGSAYMCETRIELTVTYQERWEPIVLDDYLQTVLTTRPRGSDPSAPGVTTVIDRAS